MRKKFYYREIFPCFLAVFIDVLGFGLAFPLLTAIFMTGDFLPVATAETTRLAYLAIGFALYPFFMFFGSSFMGDLSDIVGRKKVLIFCMAGFCIGFFLMGTAFQIRSLSLLFIGRSLTGLTAASLPTTMAAIVDLSPPKAKATHMSFAVLVQALGLIFAPLMAGFFSQGKIISFFNEATPFFTSGLLALIVLVLVFLFFTESFKGHSNKKIHPFRIFLIFFEMIQHSRIRILTIVFLLHQIGLGIYLQTVLILLHQKYQYGSFKMGLFNAFFGLWLALGTLTISLLVKRIKIEWIACIAIIGMGASELIMASFPYEILLWVLTILLGICGTVAWSAMLTSFSNAADETSQGWALGITGAIVALAFLLSGFAPNLIPYLGPALPTAVGGVCLILGAFIMFFYLRKYCSYPFHSR